jgi:chemotaxis protein MotA
VLENLSAPSTLGPAISTAFIATLMGVGSANVIFLPIAARLKAMSADEVELRTLTLDGILAVQAGDNPRIVAEKLSSYVPPQERGAGEDEGAGASQSRPDDMAEPAREAA